MQALLVVDAGASLLPQAESSQDVEEEEIYMDSYRAIEQLIYTYAERVDAGDLEGMAQLFRHADYFAPDGKVVARGAEEFLAIHRRLVKIYPETGTPCTRHVTTNVIIELDEVAETATARSYFTVFQAAASLALQPIIAGSYRDSFERVDGQWRFRSRQTLPDLPGDLSRHLAVDIATLGH